MRDVIVVGGGIVGLATAYEILPRRPGSDVSVVEKESGVARARIGARIVDLVGGPS